jgi:acyl-coenzyme A synthetase/AMP-(fatty) acid ligase
LFPGTYVLGDPAGGHDVHWPEPQRADEIASQPMIDVADESIAARVLTSGSTGTPMPYTKSWGLLWRNTEAGAARLAAHLGRPDLEGVSLVATVPAQHMFGFESSVLVALLGGAAFEVSRPFFPADIAAALARIPRPRLLITTPLHLRTLLDSGVAIPPIDLTVCATAPLAPQLALRAEAQLGAPLMEIYGCTEAGQIATRRTTHGEVWHTYAGVQLSLDTEVTIASGGHVPQPTPLADILDVLDTTHFRLLGRANDLINVAGKRSSLGHLNFHLNSVEGVKDGAFWYPGGEPAGSTVRLVALVVAPGVTRERIIDALRTRIDAAFLPRRVIWVDTLPRDPTGKLPTSRLASLATRLLAGVDPAARG